MINDIPMYRADHMPYGGRKRKAGPAVKAPPLRHRRNDRDETNLLENLALLVAPRPNVAQALMPAAPTLLSAPP